MATQQPLLIQKPYKIMAHSWLERTRVKFFGKSEEWLWIMAEKAYLKNGLRVRQLVLF